MSKEITFTLEPDNGKLTTEVSGISTDILTDLRFDLGTSQNVNCGKPVEWVTESIEEVDSIADNSQSVWLYRIYHDSVVDGPGRRSVIQVAGCSIRCKGCYVPDTHDRQNGSLILVGSIVQEIISRSRAHDGVTILGGEPFDQPNAVAEIVFRLKRLGQDILIYSGYTVENLVKKNNASIDYILTHVDKLIDGPFIYHLSNQAGEFRGSTNQKSIGFPKS